MKKRIHLILPSRRRKQRGITLRRYQRGIIGAAGGSTMVDAGSGVSVSARLDGRTNSLLDQACYVGFQLQNDGDEYEYGSTGSLTNLTTWLDSGSASDAWVTWNRTGGTESDWNNIGSGNNGVRLNLGTTRSFRLLTVGFGVDTITGYCQFHDAASGGNLLQTTSTVTWSAENEFDPCPICCFTPDTLITMANGMRRPIEEVREGDLIMVEGGIEAVTEVISRKRRTMHRLKFDDGRHLDLSEDHPIHCEVKGYACVRPVAEYKDIGITEKLAIGDEVTLEDRSSIQLVAIEDLDYSLEVYTFGNSKFFANGILVY